MDKGRNIGKSKKLKQKTKKDIILLVFFYFVIKKHENNKWNSTRI